MHIIKSVLVVLIIIFTVSFILENTWIIKEQYQIEYYTLKSRPIPLVLLFFGNILLGALIVALPSFLKNLRLKRLLKLDQKKMHQMDKELSSLRNLPLTEDKEIEQLKKKS